MVALERVPQFEDAVLLEYGRGFRYTRPLRINLMDLDYELLEELVCLDQMPYFTSTLQMIFTLANQRKVLFTLLCRTTLLNESAVLCLASALDREETEDQLVLLG